MARIFRRSGLFEGGSFGTGTPDNIIVRRAGAGNVNFIHQRMGA